MRIWIRVFVFAVAVSIGVAASARAELYFPPAEGTWEATSAEAAGLVPANIMNAAAYARSNTTSSLLILHEGRIVSEIDWNTGGDNGKPSAAYGRMHKGTTSKGHPIEDVASVQKSLVSFLACIAIGEGKLDLDASVTKYLGEGWSKATRAQEDAILVRHLMTMTTGLGNRLDYVSTPGTQWAYNTAVYSRIVPMLEKAFGASIDTITRERIAQPLGMSDTQWIERRWAKNSTIANAIGLSTTARDLGRFGILILAKGEWDGQALLEGKDLLKASLSSSQEHNPSYGYLWWLNGKSSFKAPAREKVIKGSMVPSAPDDMVMALGALDRKVYVVPSMKLVVVRLGDQAEPKFNDVFWRTLLGR